MTIINLSIWGWKKKIIYGQYLWNAMIIKWRKKEKHLEEMLSFWCKSWHGMNHGIWNKICNYALNFFSYVLGIDRFIIGALKWQKTLTHHSVSRAPPRWWYLKHFFLYYMFLQCLDLSLIKFFWSVISKFELFSSISLTQFSYGTIHNLLGIYQDLTLVKIVFKAYFDRMLV